jgi:trehalose synthase
VIAPAIDPFSLKNEDIDDKTVRAVLSAAGIVQGPRGEARLRRADGRAVRVTRAAEICGSSVPPDARLVVQVSRWDGLKDPVGVLRGFAEHVAPSTDSRLVLAGPGASSVQDDPEQPAVLRQVIDTREQMAPQVRERIHIVQLPMDDVDENAAIVNALQRRADVVVQKSLAEGFGLTVSEAMWKGRPIVASRVGGIEDQIEHGKSGLLIDDPRDLVAFGEAAVHLLDDRAEADRLGHEARRRAIRQFLAPRHLVEQARLVMRALQPNS